MPDEKTSKGGLCSIPPQRSSAIHSVASGDNAQMDVALKDRPNQPQMQQDLQMAELEANVLSILQCHDTLAPTPAISAYSINDFTIKNNDGGGDCLFLAFADAFNAMSMETKIHHMEARLRTCLQMYQKPKHYDAYVSREYERLGITNIQQYIDRMSKLGSWGGQPELAALCEAFNVDIVIFHTSGGNFVHTKPDNPRKIHLAFSPGHYTALIPKSNEHRQFATVNSAIKNFGYAFNGKVANVDSLFFDVLKILISFPSNVCRGRPIAEDR